MENSLNVISFGEPSTCACFQSLSGESQWNHLPTEEQLGERSRWTLTSSFFSMYNVWTICYWTPKQADENSPLSYYLQARKVSLL